jgi:dTDP-glucose 4,6-dehydratase
MKTLTSESLVKGRYLITGGAGFVGSHLCERLLDLDCEVVVIDNFITGRQQNVRHLLGNKKFSLIEKDIIHPMEMSGALAGIFHMASPASPVDYMKFPIETLRVGAIGSDNVLNLAREKNCPVLVASTSEIYGDPLEHPQKESYWGNVHTVGPRGCYDESKRYLEAITMAYHRVFNLQTRIIRIFNTYGPRMRTDDGRVVPNFCMQALAGEDITVYGEGKQTRSFCYVTDLVEGILRVIQSDHPEPINLGNPTETSIYEFAERIIRMAESDSKIAYRPLPQDDPKTRCPDISKAKRILGWSPLVNLENGLARTFEYFRSTLTAAS